MWPYLVLYFLVLGGFICELGGYIRFRKKLLILFAFIIIVVALFTGFRDLIGGFDVFIYAKYFLDVPTLSMALHENISSLNMFPIYEPGYYWFNVLVKSLTDNYYYFFLIIGCIFYYIIYKTFRKFPFFLFSFLVFFAKLFIVVFIYTRQILALAIIWYAIKYLLEDKSYKFVIAIVLASLFHYSALVTFPMLYFAKKELSRKTIIIIFLISFLLGMLPFINWGMTLLFHILGGSKLELYSEEEQAGVHLFYLIENLILAGCLIANRKEIYKDSNKIPYYNIALLYVVFTFLALRMPSAVRFIWYYFVGYAFFVPYFCHKYVRPKEVMLFIVILYFSIIFYRNLVVRGNGISLPYKVFFLDSPKRDDRGYYDYIMN